MNIYRVIYNVNKEQYIAAESFSEAEEIWLEEDRFEIEIIELISNDVMHK